MQIDTKLYTLVIKILLIGNNLWLTFKCETSAVHVAAAGHIVQSVQKLYILIALKITDQTMPSCYSPALGYVMNIHSLLVSTPATEGEKVTFLQRSLISTEWLLMKLFERSHLSCFHPIVKRVLNKLFKMSLKKLINTFKKCILGMWFGANYSSCTKGKYVRSPSVMWGITC